MPNIIEIHNYNNNAGNEYQHEYWSLTMKCGDTLLNLISDNASRKDNQGQYQPPSVTYQQNTQYFVENINYIASLQILDVTFVIGSQVVTTNLTKCTGFVLTHAPVKYDGAVPGFDCNITFNRVQVYPGTGRDSTFDLTVIHHVDVNWTRSDITTKALFNFARTRLYETNGSEFTPDTPFATEIHYGMFLMDQTHGIQITPSGYTNTTLYYNITRENGAPINVAKLNMKNNFTVDNASGSFDQDGYSSMAFGGFYSQGATVTQGFPGLYYENVGSIKSDPEIQVTYDRISVPLDLSIAYWVLLAVGVVVVIGVIFIIRKRKSKMKLVGSAQ